MLISFFCQLIFFGLAKPLKTEYSWRLYKKVGADKNFRNIYRHYLIYMCILKQFVMFCLINANTSGHGIIKTGATLAIDIIEIIIVFVILSFGYISVKKEILTLAYAYMFILFLPILYIVYSFVFNKLTLILTPDYETASLTFISNLMGIIALGLYILLIILSIGSIKNFGKGLKNLDFLKQNETLEVGEEFNDDDEVFDFVDPTNENDISILDVIRNTKSVNAQVK